MNENSIIGIDEVGRGAWAGPLVVGAVSLSRDIDGLCDSKKLTKLAREILAKKIYKNAHYVGLGWAEAFEIDIYGLSASHYLAYHRAVANLAYQVSITIDGNINYLTQNFKNSTCIIRADQTLALVSAASIVAKVARDNYMEMLELKFPGYGFSKNAGYGTKDHIHQIKQRGICSEHRKTYKPLVGL